MGDKVSVMVPDGDITQQEYCLDSAFAKWWASLIVAILNTITL
jgi:hypothetical protein